VNARLFWVTATIAWSDGKRMGLRFLDTKEQIMKFLDAA
jgi:hypothetical protein